MDNIKEWNTCLFQNCSQRRPAGKTGRGSLLNHPLCPPDDPSGQGTELNDERRGFELSVESFHWAYVCVLRSVVGL